MLERQRTKTITTKSLKNNDVKEMLDRKKLIKRLHGHIKEQPESLCHPK